MKLLYCVLILFVLSTSKVQASYISVYCADKVTYELRLSDVVKGCKNTESSLGEGPIPKPWVPVRVINPTLEIRFQAAQASAKKEGIVLKITSGYRTIAKQKVLFDRAIEKYGSKEEAAKWVALPEISRHPMGLAIDVNYPNQPMAAKWLEINGSKFG